MPVECDVNVELISEAAFKDIDYEIMSLVFAIHNDSGRLCNEKVYQKEKQRCKKNRQRLTEGDKNKKLKVALTDKEIDAWKYRIRKAAV